jgi:hypothetical protein
MRRMRSTTSGGTRGGAGDFFRERHFQSRRKPSRCQRRRVSGLTSTRALRQLENMRERTTRRKRSQAWNRGFLDPRAATVSWCRRNAFSARSSSVVRKRSARNPLATPVGLPGAGARHPRAVRRTAAPARSHRRAAPAQKPVAMPRAVPQDLRRNKLVPAKRIDHAEVPESLHFRRKRPDERSSQHRAKTPW